MVLIKEKLDSLNLNTSAFKILCYLSFKNLPLKPLQIAEDLDEKPSTVRARLAELKNAGLVESKIEGYISLIKPYDILMKFYRDIREKWNVKI